MTIRHGFLTGGMRRVGAFDIELKNLMLISSSYQLLVKNMDAYGANTPLPLNPPAEWGEYPLFIYDRHVRKGVVYNPDDSYFYILDSDRWILWPSQIAVPSNFQGMRFSNTGAFFVVYSTTAGLQIYSATSFRLVRTISLGGAVPRWVSWKLFDQQLAVTLTASPYIKVFDFATEAFLPNPATLPTGAAEGCAFSPDGTLLAVAHEVTPYVSIYAMPTFVKVANPSNLPDGDGERVRFSPLGDALHVINSSDSWDYSRTYTIPISMFTGNEPWDTFSHVTDWTYGEVFRYVWWEGSQVKMVPPAWTCPDYLLPSNAMLLRHGNTL